MDFKDQLKLYIPLILIFAGGGSLFFLRYQKFGMGWDSTKMEQFEWLIGNPEPLAAVVTLAVGAGILHFWK